MVVKILPYGAIHIKVNKHSLKEFLEMTSEEDM